MKMTNKYKVTLNVINKETQDCDYIVKSIGAFGTWQAIITLISASTRYIVLINAATMVYLTPFTEFKCVEFKEDNVTDVKNSTCYENCVNYEYYNTIFEDSLISKFGLICDSAWMASFTQSMMMMGILLGVTGFGWVSDRFGRKIAIRLTTVLAVVFMISASFAPDYWTFTVLRFFSGLGTGGIMSIGVIMAVEVLGPQQKDLVGAGVTFPDGVFLMIMSGIAYLTTTWSSFLLCCGLIAISHMIAVFFLPESPRWLISQKKGTEAIAALTSIAKTNKMGTAHIKDIIDAVIKSMNMNQKEVKKVSIADLFRTKEIAVTTTCSFIVWFLSGLCFYGITQYSTLIASNVYVLVCLLGVVHIAASMLSIFVTKYVNRRSSSVFSLVSTGLSMLILIFIPQDHWTCLLVSNIGFVASSAVFCVIYVQANELYPTNLRNMGFGVSSSGAKLGAMIAPFIANIRPQWVASAIFAVLSFVAIGFCLLLPETKNKSLKDTAT